MGKAASAAGSIATAGTYVGGRIATNTLSWVKTGLVVAAQAALLKALLDKQKHSYDDISSKQIGYVERALNEYILDVNNNLLPTFKNAYPDVPQAIAYEPVVPELMVFDQMVENIRNLPKTSEYIQQVNYLHRANFVARMVQLSPDFLTNVRLTSYQIRDLLEGRLPVGDVVEVMTDTAEMAALTGRIGAGYKTTARNLGISRLRMQAAGRAAFVEHLAMLNRDVSPISSEASLDQQMISPTNRMNLALQQAQLIQNSLQNAANIAAQKSPHLLAELQTKLQTTIARLQFSANKGNMVNQFVPNYAAVLGPAMNNVLDGINKQIGGVSDSFDQHPTSGNHPGESAGAGMI